jgi:DNA-directed RNA polymerase subunit RPC12/RpoP
MEKNTCVICGNEFEYERVKKKKEVCSPECNNKRIVDNVNKRLNGNWSNYFKHLCQIKKDARKELSPEILENLLIKQKYKCALTGIKLTCLRANGIKFKTNASIDRINSDLGYNIDNIQLVCSVVNILKSNLTSHEYIKWCKKVVKEDAIRKQKKTIQKRISATISKRRT